MATPSMDRGGVLTVTRTVNVLSTGGASGGTATNANGQLPTTLITAPSTSSIPNVVVASSGSSLLSASTSTSPSLLSSDSGSALASSSSASGSSSWGVAASQPSDSEAAYNPTWLILALVIIAIVLLSVGGWLVRRCIVRRRMAHMSRLPDTEADARAIEASAAAAAAAPSGGGGMNEKWENRFPTSTSHGTLGSQGGGRKAATAGGGVVGATDSFYAPEWATPAPPHTFGTLPAPLPVPVPLSDNDRHAIGTDGRNVPEPLLARAPTPPEGSGWAIGVATTTSAPVASVGKSAVSTTAYPPHAPRGPSPAASGSQGSLSSSSSERQLVGSKRADVKSTGGSNLGRLMLEPSSPDPQAARAQGSTAPPKLAPPVMDSSRLSADFVPLSQMAHLTRHPSYRSPTESIYGCYND